jgi:hypothetical protein
VFLDKTDVMGLPVQNEAKKRVQVVSLFMILKRKRLTPGKVSVGERSTTVNKSDGLPKKRFHPTCTGLPK